MTWAIEIDAADAAACGPLRHEAGIEACVVAGRLWLRGPDAGESLAARLRRLPALGRHAVTADGALVAEGRIVPQGRLPAGRWLPLHCWLPLEPPRVRRAGCAEPAAPRVVVTIARGGPPAEPGLLMTDLGSWTAHAVTAPAIRLARWSFAVSADRLVIVRGLPLPAVPGRRLVAERGVAVDAGWTWAPPVAPETLRAIVGAADDDLVILSRAAETAAAHCTIVPGDAFVKATRSAVRLSAAAVHGGGA